MSDRASDIVLIAICILILVIVAYPLSRPDRISLKSVRCLCRKDILFQSQFTLAGYKAVFADSSIFTGYLNSIKYMVIGTAFRWR